MGRKVKIQKKGKKGVKEKLWILVAIVSMFVYIGWRTLFTIPNHEVYGWLATVCGIFLLVSEAVSMLEGTEHFARLGKNFVPELPVIPNE